MQYKIGNLLDVTQGIVAQQVNTLGVMGSGIAPQIKKKWPGVYEVYRAEYEKNGLVLGTLTGLNVTNELYVANLVGQASTGAYGRHTSYDALVECFERLNYIEFYATTPRELHIPLIGCGLGGASWNIVEKIIDETCKFPATCWALDHNVLKGINRVAS